MIVFDLTDVLALFQKISSRLHVAIQSPNLWLLPPCCRMCQRVKRRGMRLISVLGLVFLQLVVHRETNVLMKLFRLP